MALRTMRATLGTIPYTVRVERVRPQFTRFGALAQVDVERLSRAATFDIEVGYLSSGNCRQLVRAIGRRGIVTRLEVDPCVRRAGQRAPRDLVELVRKAHRVAVRRARSRPFSPIPIRRFRSQVARIVIETITCFRICLGDFCIYCCTRPGGGLVCGAEVVVLPPIIIVF
jgi:hypothetical protein